MSLRRKLIDEKLGFAVGASLSILVFVSIFYELRLELFNIDEYIISEGVDLNLREYLSINPIFGRLDRTFTWLFSRLPVGEPLAWRLMSAIAGAFTLILIAGQSQKSAGWPAAAVSVLLVVTQADFQFWSRWGVSSYAIAAFFAVALWEASNVRLLRARQVGVRIIGYGALALVGACFSITVAVPATLIPLARLISDWPRSMKFKLATSWIGQSGLAVLSGVIVMETQRLDAAFRPSLHQYIFPESGMGIADYLAARGSDLAMAMTERASIDGWLAGGLLILVLVVGIVAAGLRRAHAQLHGLASEVRALSILFPLLVAANATIGVFGLGPFGLLRHAVSLVPLSALLISTGGTLLVATLVRRYCPKRLALRLASVSTVTFVLLAILAAIVICSSTIKERRLAVQNAQIGLAAYRQEADLYLIDVLHKFSFERITQHRPIVYISRGYPCIEGRYWDAYGWNECPNAYTAPTPPDLDAINAAGDILVVSRGSLESPPYAAWMSALQRHGCIVVSHFRATGPYITRFECNRS